MNRKFLQRISFCLPFTQSAVARHLLHAVCDWLKPLADSTACLRCNLHVKASAVTHQHLPVNDPNECAVHARYAVRAVRVLCSVCVCICHTLLALLLAGERLCVLTGLPALRSLSLVDGATGEESLAHVGRCTKLTRLELQVCSWYLVFCTMKHKRAALCSVQNLGPSNSSEATAVLVSCCRSAALLLSQ